MSTMFFYEKQLKHMRNLMKIRLYNEFKYWKADIGSERDMAKLVPDQQKMTSKLLNSAPKIEESKP